MLFALIITQVFYFILGCELYHTPIIIPDFGAFCFQCYEIKFIETDLVISIYLPYQNVYVNSFCTYFLSPGTKYVQLKL